MKKTLILTVMASLCTAGLFLACSNEQVDSVTPSKRFAPNANTSTGIIVDSSQDENWLIPENEVISLASSIMGLSANNATVTWISSQDFYGGYERILLETASIAELADFYSTTHVVPSKALCVVNFDNAFVIINPDMRGSGKNLFISAGHGRTFDPNLLKWTNTTAGQTITDSIFDTMAASVPMPYRIDVRDDLKQLKYCTDELIFEYNNDHAILMCAPLIEPYISLCSHEDLVGAYDDCDSVRTSIARALGLWESFQPILPRPTVPGDNIQSDGGNLSTCSTNNGNDYPLDDFMQMEYCDIILYVERYIGVGSQFIPLSTATNFLRNHGINVLTYTGDNESVVNQSLLEGKVPLIYKEGDWSVIYRVDKQFWNCPDHKDFLHYLYWIDKCRPESTVDVKKTIPEDATIVILEY